MSFMFVSRCLIFSSLMVGLTFSSCKKDDPAPSTSFSNATVFVADTSLLKPIVEVYANIALAGYEDALTTAKKLRSDINNFVTNPSAVGLEDCKQSWKEARVPYGQLESLRFCGGPIDYNNGPEVLINAWPLNEAYIDYVFKVDSATFIVNGIINNGSTKYANITKTSIVDWNTEGGETNVSSGYHAIEFLLWGQDLSATGPGNRPYTDYVLGSGGTATNQSRRGDYLKAVADLLVDNLRYMVDQWKEGSNNYRKSFTANTRIKLSTADMLLGIGSFLKGEMASQRMAVSLILGDQEDEHDCFSDYTLIDIQNWHRGVKALLYGRYDRIDGSRIGGNNLMALIKNRNNTQWAMMDAKIAEVDAELLKLKGPWDQIILDPVRNAQAKAITTLLKDEADIITQFLTTIGIVREFNERKNDI